MILENFYADQQIVYTEGHSKEFECIMAYGQKLLLVHFIIYIQFNEINIRFSLAYRHTTNEICYE